MKNHLSSLRLAAFATVVLVVTAPVIFAQAKFQEDAGTLPDGTPYRMRMPSNWNKIVISDLDYAGAAQGKLTADNERNMFLLERGYAISGTARHARREYEYDPAKEISNLITVLDKFEAKFGKPTYVIEYGHSGGGYIALAMAEIRPDRINGAVAGCGHVPVWLANTFNDGWFALKALLAPNLQIADVPEDLKPLSAEWRKAFETAQQTPQGRARMALAAIVGQWPVWSGERNPKPDPKNAAALQKSIYEMLVLESSQVGGAGRFMFEHAGGGQPASNVGTDYRKFFDNASDVHKRAVRALYKEAGLDLNADLDKINSMPRIAAKQSALDWWAAVPGRTPTGVPKVPVLRFHTVGDLAVPISILQGYEAKVRANGNDLYRQAMVDAPVHCAFTAGESMAAIETVLNRVKTGMWNTDPEQLNKLGDSFSKGKSRFVRFEQEKYNHPWFPARPAVRSN